MAHQHSPRFLKLVEEARKRVFNVPLAGDTITHTIIGEHDAARVLNWAIEVRGRGACRHPDGAAGMVLSALQVFESEVTRHTQQLSCSMPPPVPGASRWTW